MEIVWALLMAERDPGIVLLVFADLSEMPSQDTPVLPGKGFGVCFHLFLPQNLPLLFYFMEAEPQSALGGKGPSRSSYSNSSAMDRPPAIQERVNLLEAPNSQQKH